MQTFSPRLGAENRTGPDLGESECPRHMPADGDEDSVGPGTSIFILMVIPSLHFS